MRSRPRFILAASAAAITLACGIWWLFSAGKPDGVGPGGEDAAGTGAPEALVRTDRIGREEIRETIMAYGTIVPAPGAVQMVSVPFESRVRRLMVSGGQRIARGEVLLEIEPSPDTRLQVEEARVCFGLAEENLRHTEQRFDLKLATNDQLLQARQTFQQEKLRLESLEGRGIDGPRELTAEVAGLVRRIHVQEGSIVAPGGPFLEIVAQNRLEARLGVEPDEIDRVQAGQPVALHPVNLPGVDPVLGETRRISRAVDPEERLIDIFVALPESRAFLLGEYVQGTLTVATARGLVVPRSAVLPEGGGHALFTVEGGRAVQREVQVGLEDGERVQVSGEGLREGDLVVISGNHELEDGMAVREEERP